MHHPIVLRDSRTSCEDGEPMGHMLSTVLRVKPFGYRPIIVLTGSRVLSWVVSMVTIEVFRMMFLPAMCLRG